MNTYITRGCFHIPPENTGDAPKGCGHHCGSGCCNKLDVNDWLADVPDDGTPCNLVEVRFKNTRKAYYINNTDIPLAKGDVVAVEASPGHDVGVVSLTGALVPLQMKRNGASDVGLKKIYRKAKAADVEKWFQAIEKEPETMRLARQIVSGMNLPMKISDVEFQGDKTKATFFYISDDRVDFRQLIKDFADHFRIRIEMKQIGARQEAGKVGGIGTCGRELCCSQWMSAFASVSTSAARYQEMMLNPQKLAGQCGKLKCCLNFELKCYVDAQKDFPDFSTPLETEQGRLYYNKVDVFRRVAWYSFGKGSEDSSLMPLDVDVVKDILEMNRQGVKAQNVISRNDSNHKAPDISYQNAVGEDSISRFEEKRRKKKKKPRRAEGQEQQAQRSPSQQQPRQGQGQGRPQQGTPRQQQASQQRPSGSGQPRPNAQTSGEQRERRNDNNQNRQRFRNSGPRRDGKPATPNQ